MIGCDDRPDPARRTIRRDPIRPGARSGRDVYVVFVFWPLIAGFIAFVLLAVLMGWIMDTSRRG